MAGEYLEVLGYAHNGNDIISLNNGIIISPYDLYITEGCDKKVHISDVKGDLLNLKSSDESKRGKILRDLLTEIPIEANVILLHHARMRSSEKYFWASYFTLVNQIH
jgi:hypothetical protein